jgi:heme/copper-type cytochrome/quinol oxidase subunit 2
MSIKLIVLSVFVQVTIILFVPVCFCIVCITYEGCNNLHDKDLDEEVEVENEIIVILMSDVEGEHIPTFK